MSVDASGPMAGLGRNDCMSCVFKRETKGQFATLSPCGSVHKADLPPSSVDGTGRLYGMVLVHPIIVTVSLSIFHGMSC